MIYIINIIFILLFVGGAFYFWRRSSGVKVESLDEPASSEHTLISISVPKNNDRAPQAAEQMFAALHGIFREGAKVQSHVSFEIVSSQKFISFFVYYPSDLHGFVTSQIYAQYPNVEIKVLPPGEDYATVSEELAVAATELSLKRPSVYPIKTFLNFDVDPLSAITGVLSAVGQNEQVWIQLMVSPIDDNWQDLGDTEIKFVKEPPPKQVGILGLAGGELKTFAVDLIKSLLSGQPGEVPEKKESKPKELTGPTQQAIKGIEEKITKLGFGASMRIVASSPEQFSANAKLEQVVGAYKQFNTINQNSFVSGQIVTDHQAVTVYRNREFGSSEMIFNITELASLFHFPSQTVTTPTIAWAGSKKGEPPPNLPILGTVPADDLTLLGATNFRSEVAKFGIKKKDRRLHSYIIGKTGTGKSTLLENMIYDDIKEGRGLAVVDPHGQLIEHVLKFIPEDRIKDVVYFNPSDHDWPVGFNPLENKNLDPEKKVILSSGVVGVFKKIFGESWGPRMEYILRNAILGLLDYPHATLLGVMRVLSDNAFRRQVISEIKDPTIKSFFVDEYEKYDPKFRQEAINPIQNKVGQFLSSSIIRNIVGQPNSTIHLEDVMNSGKILLADLSIGRMGEDNSALLGSMLITQIQLAAMSRTNIPEEERRDFYLYVDEFQNFATDSFATILSEARKYRLSLVMAHQYVAQMPETVADAVFGNIGTMVSFRVGAGDASKLKEEFAPVFDENDLVNLANYQIYLKMAIDGVTVPAFSAATLAPPDETYDNVSEVIEASRKAYGRSRSDVEDYIAEWSAPIKLSDNTPPPAHSIKESKSMDRIVTKGESPEEGKLNISALPKKTEIIKDRFQRQWYAISGGLGEGADKTEVPEAAISEQVIESLHMEENIEKKNEAARPQSGGAGERIGEDTHLITWDQADELGLKLENNTVKRPAINEDFEPIDEL